MAQLSDRVRALMQPHLASIEPYDPNFTPCRVNLSANENTYPMPAAARASIDAALVATPLNRYPDPMSNELRAEIAAWHGVDPSWVCVGNGGDELLYNFLLAFGGAGRTLLNCPPCFSEYAFFASLAQTKVLDVWRDSKTFELDQAAVLEAAPKCDIAIVTSPNNPTGDLASVEFVREIPLRILKTRPEFSEKSMGAFALPAKSSTNKGKAFSQVVSCFANGLRMRRISKFNCNRIRGMEAQFLAKPVFGAVCA